MTRSYRRSRRSRTRYASRGLLSSFLLIVIGVAGFYGAMQWFRSDADDTLAMTPEEATTEEVVAETPAEQQMPVEASSPLVSAFDGQHTGKVDRLLKTDTAEFYLIAYLPPLDLKAHEYHVWLLKDGLADVRDMGTLAPRADGSWVLNFSANPVTGITDPERYTSVVIMREPTDGNPAPSGYRMAEASFRK